MKALVTRAAIKAAEILYSQYVAGDTSNEVDLMYILLSVDNSGLDNIQRYKDMLSVLLIDAASAESFKATYRVPTQPATTPAWPDILQAAPTELVSEEQLLENKKLARNLAINKLRDSKIDSGFEFRGNVYQSRPSDRENIMGASIAAKMAIDSGAQVGDYRWSNPDSDFMWITMDNQLIPMDAYDVIELYQTGAAFKTALTFKARQLKDEIMSLSTVEQVNAYQEVW